MASQSGVNGKCRWPNRRSNWTGWPYPAHLLMCDLKIKEKPRSKAKRGYALLKGE